MSHLNHFSNINEEYDRVLIYWYLLSHGLTFARITENKGRSRMENRYFPSSKNGSNFKLNTILFYKYDFENIGWWDSRSKNQVFHIQLIKICTLL